MVPRNKRKGYFVLVGTLSQEISNLFTNSRLERLRDIPGDPQSCLVFEPE
jgi:hypothetical protein